MAFEFEVRPYDDPDVVRMVADVQAEYVGMYGGPDSAVVTLTEFAPPDGLFVVGVLDGLAVATGGWRRRSEQDGAQAEIKRMYVAPAARGRGLSRLVLAELERTALAAGVRRLVLNTGQPQQPAIALYRSAGYRPAAPFGHYADSPSAVFLGKDLVPATTRW
ncbi:GNAT family N-acetyltransferase [uncultured Jatrophihabitans sp.]|uniref:GNAT family N-acetyltransferase n=1 Tax=uncultured Jatrophihabitans sp. TaxID=1610747 RepID=UPI0035CC4B1C